MTDRPNILILMADELNVATTSVYGHSFIRTPNMQRLADSGVTVEHAYCNSPLCVPSRASFMSGRYASQIGVYDLSSRLASEEPTWAHSLNAAGYETVLSGKMHFIGPDQRHGFQKRIVEDCHGDGTHHGVPDWDAPPRHASEPSGRLVKAGRAGKSKYVEYDYSVRDETVKYLQEYGNGAQEKPFALCASFISPHFPLVVEEEYFNMYYPEHADLPAHPEPFDHPKYERIRQFFSLYGVDEDSVRRCRAAYYGLITFVDKMIGDILDALEAAGVAENTFILFTTDHGDMMGEKGLWWKSSFLEGSARVPMICSWPGRLPAGERRDNVLSLIDVFPTLLDVVGATKPDFLEGASFLPLLATGDTDWKDEAVIECLAHTAIHPEAAVVKGRYKYLYFVEERPQLFDLKEDPDELRDLASQPEYQSLLQEFEDDLLSWWPVEELDRAVRASQKSRRYRRSCEIA